jgi:hypothetical protein
MAHELTIWVQWECSCGATGNSDCQSEIEAELQHCNHLDAVGAESEEAR